MLYRLLIVILAIACVATDAINDLLVKLRSTPMDAILYWNFVAVQADGNNYDRSVVSSLYQPDPAFASRTFAIIHGAMYDAVAVFTTAFKPVYTPNNLPNMNNVDKKSAVDAAAVMEAAYQTLRALHPQQQAIFDAVGDYNTDSQ